MELGDSMDLVAKINGVPFNAMVIMAGGPTVTVLTAQGSYSQAIQIELAEGASIVTHDVGGSSKYIIIYAIGTNNYPSEGALTLTSIKSSESVAAGTFEVTATSPDGQTVFNITEGAFIY